MFIYAGDNAAGVNTPVFPCDSAWFTVAAPDLALRVRGIATRGAPGALGGGYVGKIITSFEIYDKITYIN